MKDKVEIINNYKFENKEKDEDEEYCQSKGNKSDWTLRSDGGSTSDRGTD